MGELHFRTTDRNRRIVDRMASHFERVRLGTLYREIRNRLLGFTNIPTMKQEGDVNGLLRALLHTDPDIQFLAAEALGELGDPVAIPALARVLSADRYSAVSWQAAVALTRIGPPSVDALIPLTGSESEDVRWKAALALGEIGDLRALEPLIALLGDRDHYVQSRAATALGMLGQEAVPALIRELREGDGGHRWGAAIALGRIRDPRAIAPLVNALGDKYENVRSEALSSLRVMESGNVDLLIRVLNEVGNEEIRLYVEQQGDPHAKDSTAIIPYLLQADKDIRAKVIQSLKNIDDPSLEPLIRDLSE